MVIFIYQHPFDFENSQPLFTTNEGKDKSFLEVEVDSILLAA